MAKFSTRGAPPFRPHPSVAFTFVAYFSIGAPLAVLPAYVHLQLGLSAVLAGLLVSLQYIATFASRPRAGHLADRIGPRKTVSHGLIFCGSSGALLLLATLPRIPLGLGLGGLALSRLALGVGESLTSTGATMWGIGVAGPRQTAQVISWNGVATYSALAIGAPLGALIASQWGFAAVGAIIAAVCLGSFKAATRMAPTARVKGQQVPLRRILLGVFPYGTGLALGGMGFGVLATFVTLYFAQRGWTGAALALTAFGATFVSARLLFASAIDRFGGFPVALVSFGVETAGLVLLGLCHSQVLAYVGSGLTGLGFSLIFPALAVEAANTFPTSARGSVLGVYTAFVDISLFLAGPMAGAVIGGYGYPAAFLGTAGLVLLALACTFWLATCRTSARVEPAG